MNPLQYRLQYERRLYSPYFMPIKTIFLDRDGVINKDVNYLYKINDFIFIDGIFDACKHFEKLGYKIIVVTNQSGIHRKLYTENDYQKLTQWMLSQFKKNHINIFDIYHCPHGPKSNCRCRKPKAGMLIKAQSQYGINMESSWIIGDKNRDILAGINAGIKNTILLSNSSVIAESSSYAKYVVNSLEETKKLITH